MQFYIIILCIITILIPEIFSIYPGIKALDKTIFKQYSINSKLRKQLFVDIIKRKNKTQVTLMSQISKLSLFIPQAKINNVEKALLATFHVSDVENIVLLNGNLSTALVYKIVINDTAYLLRIIMKADELNNPMRQFACMDIAAEAGIAPKIYYYSSDDALSISSFIENRPLSEGFPSITDILPKLVSTIKAIHALPIFPFLVNYMDGIDMLIEQYKALNMLPESATADCFRYYSDIQKVYPRFDTDRVSSHNDLNPNNILFDGEKIWVIDWETAFQNDRYVDLAIVAKSFVTNEAEEEQFLNAYFGSELDEYKRARFFLMQQVTHLFYAMIMLKSAHTAHPDKGTQHDSNMATPRLHDFYLQIGSGKVSLASYEGQLLYAKVLLNEALCNMKTTRFTTSIALVDEKYSGQ